VPDYTVQKGNTLSGIAAKLHTTWQRLFNRNRKVIGPNPNNLKPGQRLAYGPLPTHLDLPPKKTPTVNPKPVPHTPPVNRLVQAAITKAKALFSCIPDMCDHYTAWYYGLNASGYGSAVENANAVPQRYRHLVGKAGMAAFWSGGSGHYGHAALYLGNGWIRCTDMDANGNYAPGKVSTIPITDVHDRWGLTFMFFTDPYFAGRLITVV
jgi:hypothetical protein